MIYIIYLLFIVYTIICCLDGPDLKPKWKTWLGNKLHGLGNKYVLLTPYIPLPPIHYNLYETRYKPLKLKSFIKLSELDIFYLGEKKSIQIIKEQCINGLCNEIKNNSDKLINIEINDDYHTGGKYGCAEIQICIKDDNNTNW